MNSYESLRDHLFELEKRLLRPEVRHSADELVSLLADDFMEIGSSGQVYDRPAIIQELSDEITPKISVSDFNLRLLAPNLALVTYRADFYRDGNIPVICSLRSSIWKQNGDSWQIIFHQGTPIVI
ncbi:MAG: DUF4440 domain-containing protein [Candidatus Zixiibacteriota bacterium]